MQNQTLLLFGLAGAAGLVAYTRTKQGELATADATDATLDEITVVGTRLANAFMSRGYHNNNPGNIRFIAKNAWNGQIGNDGGYGIYDSPQAGTRALGRQLRAYANRGMTTVREVISTWAPPSENLTQSYISDVCNQLDCEPDDELEIGAMLPAFAKAIAKHENGYVDSGYNWNWANL